MRKLFAMLLFALVSTVTITAQSDPPLLLRFPTVSKTRIVFNYANDLWIVSRDGGDAHRERPGRHDRRRQQEVEIGARI